MARKTKVRGRARLQMVSLEDRCVPAGLAVTNDYPEGRLLVTFAEPGAEHDRLAALTRPPLATRAKSLGLGVYQIDLPAGAAVRSSLPTFAAIPGVLAAEPDYTLRAATTPNDPHYGSLWGLHNPGTDADIDAPEAWDVGRGTGNTIVAVLDTGVDYTHPDLAANMWRNPGEVAGDNIDNDGNGWVDDVFGADFHNNDANPMDDNNHGTHCAGTIGAVGNNGLGVTGVAWTTRIMALKFLGSNGSGSTSNAVRAIDYALARGAKVLSNSWGGTGSSVSLQGAIQRARTAGAIVVAAAGNSGSNNDASPFYPANYSLTFDNTISVAATTQSDTRASFSNYGANSVTLGAPGVSILSTVVGGGYASFSGTSMATPHVAGALAVLWDANPTWSYQQVLTRLTQSVDPLPALAGITATGGRLNLQQMLDGSPTVPPTVPPPAPAPTFSDDFSTPAPRPEWRFPNGTWGQAGGVMAQTGAAAGDPKKATLGGLSWGVAQEVTARVRVDAWAAGDAARAGVGVATDGAGRGYNLVFHGANRVQFLHDAVVWGNAYTFNWQAGAWYRFRLQQDAGGTLRGKVWADGAAEPTAWMFTQAGWAARSGSPALNGGSSAGGSHATVSFDDVAAGAPGGVPTVPPTVPPPPAPPSDTTGARVTGAAFSGPAGGLNQARLTLSEAIDPATFTTADVVALTGPGGAIAPTAVAAVAGTGGTRFDVTFATQTAGGTYTLTVGPDVRDAAGNPMDQNQNAVNGEVPADRYTGSATLTPPTVPPPAPPPAPAPTFSDDFSTPAPRPEWRFPNGTWGQAGGVMAQTGAAAGDPKKATLGGLSWGVAQEVTARVRVDAWAAGDAARAGVGVATDGAGRGYNLVFHGANRVQFLHDAVVWGNAYTFNWQAGAWYRFRLQQDAGGTLRGKVWADGAAEPTAWMFTQAGWAARSGSPALNGGSSFDGAYATASFDDVAAYNGAATTGVAGTSLGETTPTAPPTPALPVGNAAPRSSTPEPEAALPTFARVGPPAGHAGPGKSLVGAAPGDPADPRDDLTDGVQSVKV